MTALAVDLDALTQQLLEHEGLRLKPYRDTLGNLTIGVGRNLSGVGISEGEARILLRHDIDATLAGLTQRIPWWLELDAARQLALADLAFNIGVEGVLLFRQMLIALRAHDYPSAVRELLDSRWATQVQPSRVRRLVHLLETGRLHADT